MYISNGYLMDNNEFMKAQIHEIELYKYLKSELVGRDLGNDCCKEWIETHAKSFRKKWNDSHQD